MDPADSAIDAFLEGAPRSDTWRELKEVLAARLKSLCAERDSLPFADPRRTTLARKIAELDHQVAALAQEEAVTRFVEESVRATVALPKPWTPEFDDEADE